MRKIKEVWEQILALPAKSRLGITGLLFFVFIISFMGTLLYWRMKTPKAKPPLPKPVSTPPKGEVKKASLSLVPNQKELKVGQTFSLGIEIKTGDFKVDTVDVILSFDPSLLMVEKITPGQFFAEYPIQKKEKGKILLTGTVGISGKQKGGVKGRGDFASVTFRTLASGSAKIYFDQKRTVVASRGENVLGEAVGGEYEITL